MPEHDHFHGHGEPEPEEHHHPAPGGAFTPEDRAALGQVISNQATQANLDALLAMHLATYFLNTQRELSAMTQALRDVTAASVALEKLAADEIRTLTADKAALTTQVTDLTAQVATLSATQEDVPAETAAADALTAQNADLQAALDAANPPPPAPEPEPAPEPVVEPDPNAQ